MRDSTAADPLTSGTPVLAGRVALVTGAASGIGAAVARLLAAQGAVVFCADINEVGARTTARSVTASPAPLPLRRLRGRERWHLTLLGPSRARVHAEAKRIARRGQATLPHGVRMQLDLDPVHLL